MQLGEPAQMAMAQEVAEWERPAPPTDASGPRPLDRKHLQRYTFGNIDLEEEVLGLFLAQLPDTIGALRTAPSDRDWRIAAHTLKGSSRCIGAWRLARAAEQAERVGGIANRGICLEALLRIEDAAAEVRSEILRLHAGP